MSIDSSVDSFNLKESSEKGYLKTCLGKAMIDAEIATEILEACFEE